MHQDGNSLVLTECSHPVLPVESKLRSAQRVEKEFHSARGSGRVQKAVVHYGDELVEESEAETESESESQEVYQVVRIVARFKSRKLVRARIV